MYHGILPASQLVINTEDNLDSATKYTMRIFNNKKHRYIKKSIHLPVYRYKKGVK